MTLLRAGFNKKMLRGRATGIFVGDTGTDWDPSQVMERADNPSYGPTAAGNCKASPFGLLGIQSNVTASRLSFSLGLKGASTTIDTACSASLVGVATGVQGLRRADAGQLPPAAEKNAADFVGIGINTLLSAFGFIALCGPSMLAKNGRCFTFDNSAEGYARGDGFGGVYVMPSSKEEDHMNQIACLMGCFVNQDGRSATLTAPNGVAQQMCIRESMKEANVEARQITIAECHGTGTALGDPIEIGALRGVMEPRETPLLTTSAKSNFGHQEACAGVAGLLKCIIMASCSGGMPNVHLLNLNPHLDVDGFPAYFETEFSDTGLNSGYAGVSSFGFSGTNARADIWSRCKFGARRASGIDLERVDQMHVQCPVTMGLMEYLTGEPVTKSFREKVRYKADVIRDEWAPYDISRYAYEGGFRYRREPVLGNTDDALPATSSIHISGSWTGWNDMEEMQRGPNNEFSFTIALGECRCELFKLFLNGDRSQEIYPAIKNATSTIWIEGPDGDGKEKYWSIDGRDEQLPVGTAYNITFVWSSERKQISWQRVDEPRRHALKGYRHSYCLIGSFGGWKSVELRPDETEDGVWQGIFRIGTTGCEEFYFLRDNDPNQAIYPAEHEAIRTTVPVRGPDGWGSCKHWLYRGPPGDILDIRLRVVDAHVTVEVASDVKGTKIWESVEGWNRHEYCVVGSFTDWIPQPMTMNPTRPGVFQIQCRMPEGLDENFQTPPPVETFQVLVDGDFSQIFHPIIDHAGSGEVIVVGPDSEGDSLNWAVKSFEYGAVFVVSLDLTAVDRRRMVTWLFSSDELESDRLGFGYLAPDLDE